MNKHIMSCYSILYYTIVLDLSGTGTAAYQVMKHL